MGFWFSLTFIWQEGSATHYHSLSAIEVGYGAQHLASLHGQWGSACNDLFSDGRRLASEALTVDSVLTVKTMSFIIEKFLLYFASFISSFAFFYFSCFFLLLLFLLLLSSTHLFLFFFYFFVLLPSFNLFYISFISFFYFFQLTIFIFSRAVQRYFSSRDSLIMHAHPSQSYPDANTISTVDHSNLHIIFFFCLEAA